MLEVTLTIHHGARSVIAECRVPMKADEMPTARENAIKEAFKTATDSLLRIATADTPTSKGPTDA